MTGRPITKLGKEEKKNIFVQYRMVKIILRNEKVWTNQSKNILKYTILLFKQLFDPFKQKDDIVNWTLTQSI